MYINDALTLAKQLIDQHYGKTCLLKLNRSKRVLGMAQWKFGTPIITLSTYFIENNNEAEVKETIRHEIAHVICGPNHGHDWLWRVICVRIGCRPERCADPKTIVSVKGRYQLVCPTCGKIYNAHRLGSRMKAHNNWGCGVCRTGNLGWVDTHTNLPVFQSKEVPASTFVF